MAQSLLARKLLPEVRKEIQQAKAHLADTSWVEKASTYSKESALKTSQAVPEELAEKRARYLEFRATSGHDTSELIEYTRLMHPKKAEAYKHFGGWLVARLLRDDDGVVKPFAFYPAELYGKPPYLYPTKPQAQKALDKMRDEGRHDGSNLVVVRYHPRMYINRN